MSLAENKYKYAIQLIKNQDIAESKQKAIGIYRSGKDIFRRRLFAHDKELCMPSTKEKLMKISPVLANIFKGKNFTPQTFEICPTSKCNLRCPTCIDKEAMVEIGNELSKETIINSIRAAIAIGVPSFKFAGFGEPTMKTEAVYKAYEIIGEARKDISMITNGVELDDKLLRVIISFGTEFRVSIPTFENDLYRKLTCPVSKKTNADSVLALLKRMIDMRNSHESSKLLIGASILLYPSNFRTMKLFVMHLINLGVDYIMIKPCLTEGNAIGFDGKGKSEYQEIDKLNKLATPETAIFTTTERIQSAQFGRAYLTCKVAGIAPMILPSKKHDEFTLWTCGRGKGRKGFELSSLKAVPIIHNTSDCPPVCKEDAYNMAIENQWIVKDITTRGQLVQFTSQKKNSRKSERGKYLEERLEYIRKNSGCDTELMLKTIDIGISLHERIYGMEKSEVMSNNALDDIILFGIYGLANNYDSIKLLNLYKYAEYSRHRALAPQRLENLYKFF